MRTYVYSDSQIAGGTSVDALVALTSDVYGLAVVNARGYVNVNFNGTANHALALTSRAGGCNYGSLAAAARADFS